MNSSKHNAETIWPGDLPHPPPTHFLRQQFLFLVTATEGGVERIELVPVLISNAQVNTAHGAVIDEMHKHMAELSAAMGTEVRREGDHLVIDSME